MSEKDITTKLWAMANELRGNMDASEYKNYILAFMFYRYLSEHQEDYLKKNDILDIEDGESINDAYVREASGDDLADYLEDIASSLGYAIEPHDTWASLIKRVQDKEVIPSDYQDLLDHFAKNTELANNKTASQDFRGVFNDVNLGDSRLGSNTNDRAKSISKIVQLVDTIEYKDENGKDILGTIYEYLIGQFAASAGKKGGEFYTPFEVSKVLAKLVTANLKGEPEEFEVYDPTCGSGSLLLTVQGEVPGGKKPGVVKFYGQEKNTTTYNLSRMNLMMHGVEFTNIHLSNADTLEADWPDGLDAQGIDRPKTNFDAVVANPPYSAHWDNNENKLKDPRFSAYGKLAPKTKADYAFVLHGLYHLSPEGTMAIVLPHGVLFRGAAEGVSRQNIIEKNYLDAVIGLPANLFYGVSIPTIVLVFKKNRQNKDIFFIDASREFEKGKNQNKLTEENIDKIISTYLKREDVDKYAHKAELDEIKENDYNLNIPRYVDTFEPEPPVDLGKVADELEEVNQKIAENKKELLGMLKELTTDDDDLRAQLDKFISVFEKN